jgi:hypothetical protein
LPIERGEGMGTQNYMIIRAVIIYEKPIDYKTKEEFHGQK